MFYTCKIVFAAIYIWPIPQPFKQDLNFPFGYSTQLNNDAILALYMRTHLLIPVIISMS